MRFVNMVEINHDLNISGFLDKNRDIFSADLIGLISSSKCEYLNGLFSREKSMVSEVKSKQVIVTYKMTLVYLMRFFI